MRAEELTMARSVKVKIDRSPVADLKRPFNTRDYRDAGATGSIELAYLRGVHAGREDAIEEAVKVADTFKPNYRDSTKPWTVGKAIRLLKAS